MKSERVKEMKLNEKISLYRKKTGLSQETFAEKIGVSRQAVSKWETGESLPEVSKLKAIADCFGVTVDFLLSEDEKPPEKESAAERKSFADRFDLWLNDLPDKVIDLCKRFDWVLGIVLALFGFYRILTIFPGLSIISMAGGAFSGGISISFGLVFIFNLIIGVAMLVGGIAIAVKCKKRKNKEDLNE